MGESEELLRSFVEESSERAFGELVRRHIGMVYAAALRQASGDSGLAADIVQEVFVALALKAGRIPPGAPVAGWLYRHTRFTAAKAVRGESRRRTREREAVAMNALNSSEDNWDRVAPLLDEAVSRLSTRDRDAVVLRFFEGHDLRSVGAALGTNEDAAQKRIARALEKLRILLERRGVAVSTATLVSLLGAHGAVAVPGGLVTTVAATALSVGTAGSSLLSLLFMANVKTLTVGALVIVGLATPLALQYVKSSALRAENEELRAQLGHAAAEVAPAANSAFSADSEQIELMRLRAEVARLRAQQSESAALQARNRSAHSNAVAAASRPATPQPAEDYLPRETWADVGFATPQAALQTLGWAIGHGNIQRFKDSVVLTEGARQYLTGLLAQMHPNALEEAAKRGWGVEEGLMFPMMAQDRKEGWKGFRIESQQTPAPDEVVFDVVLEMNSGRAQEERLRFRKAGEEWKRYLDVEDLPVGRPTASK